MLLSLRTPEGGPWSRNPSAWVGTMRSGQRMAHPRDIEHLVVALIERAEGTDALRGRPGILLDLTVRGVRCLLIRPMGRPLSQSSVPEREIARMVAMGLSNKAIAHMLDISPWTVSTHLRRIFIKLSVRVASLRWCK
jgi:DNA-directed RNA polymerase specialized sigma24 family protein